MNCLYNALLLYLKTYSVEQIDKPGNTECFCRFSGGGGIFISTKTESMVISNLHDDSNDDAHDDAHSSQQQDDGLLLTSPPSPIENTEHISEFTIEGKKRKELAENV